ncbi:hypothetical protein ASE74_03185 [Pedobacter sp. Leaf216]|nr:hypothetical protein ASE74_03185 [Pedobacter sp. Leaf216]
MVNFKEVNLRKKGGIWIEGNWHSALIGFRWHGIATVRGKINPTDSVIPNFQSGLSKGAGLKQPKYCSYCFSNY